MLKSRLNMNQVYDFIDTVIVKYDLGSMSVCQLYLFTCQMLSIFLFMMC